MTDPAAVLREGRLSQRCPSCDVVEAAGWYCTACLARTDPDDWSPDGRKGRSLPDGGPEALVGVSGPVQTTAGL